MTVAENPNRLHAQLAAMIVLETVIEEELEHLIAIVSEHAGAGALFTGFQSLPREHRQALVTRLNTIADLVPPKADNVISFPTDVLIAQTYNPVTTALQMVYTMFSRALIGYSVLHAHATRFVDWLEDEGTSYHLASQFTKDYAQAIQQIIRLLHDVVLWELDRDGFECQCICPSCGIGICLCSISARFHLNTAWEEAGPFYEAAPIYVQRPKQSSPAALAGLQRGHVITAVGSQDLESWLDLQSAVRKAKPGDEIQLMIRQESGALDEVTVIHP